MKKYDAIIIGGGGGLKLRPIVDFGKKIAIIEKNALGGTCLNRGCIPSKMLIHSADVAEEIRNARRYNLKVDGELKVDFEALVQRVSAFVDGDSRKIADSYSENENIDFYRSEAKFTGDKVLEVGGEKITAERIFIATGSRPFVPQIEGLESTPYMTSTGLLRSTKLPKKLLVIGGGYIAVELGHFLGALGTDVHFLVRSKLLGQMDNEIAGEFAEEFGKKYHVHQGWKPQKVEWERNEFIVSSIDGNGNTQVLRGDELLVATGIVPNSDRLGLENTKIETDSKGFIKVDDHLRTSVDGVYALGDVIGTYLFRHSVNFQGEYLLRTLYQNPSNEPIAYSPMPYAVFSSPQIGGVGPTEEELQKSGVDYFVGRGKYKNSAMGDALRSEYGLVKLMFDRKKRKLLAGHIVGKEASTMIHVIIAYMNMGATLDDLLRTIYVHPALPEVIRNAARNADANISKII